MALKFAELARTQEYLEEVSQIATKLDRKSIDKAIGILYDAWKSDNQVFTIGNGGSASTATHLACDLNKWVSDEADRKFRAFSLVDNIPLVSALTNDNGWGDIYSEQLRNFFRKGDVLVALSVHGGSGSDKAGPWSQNLLKAVKYAKDNHGMVVGLSGFDGGVLKTASDACIVVPADSTPHVEGMHLVLTHLMCEQLRGLISAKGKKSQTY
jgi:D-sedoheptulose 7-phosphate isomerase